MVTEDLDAEAEAMGAEAALSRVVVAEPEAGLRLDKLLAQRLPDLSRSRIQAIAEGGGVQVAGVAVTALSRRVKPGEVVELHRPEPVEAAPRGQAMDLVIVHEDDDLLVLEKPAGLVVHPGAGHHDGTLVNALIAHCGDSLSGIGGVRRPGIVHRLDKDTTGLMVVAKNDHAHRHLSAQFADHGREGPLERAYRALVWGVPARRHFTIDAALDRHPHNREKMAVTAGGRFAITHVSVDEVLGEATAPVSFVTCRLETGRTHQIRVHMTHAGHPLLGDRIYGAGMRTKMTRLPEGARAALDALGHQALHAARLGFAHPRTGRTLRFESPLPAGMARLVAHLREWR
jgi:23S rRNA pseudouridine1911/1915/1917 synthase